MAETYITLPYRVIGKSLPRADAHLLDYKIPTMLDAPAVLTILLESGHGLGPFGAKGIGELAMTLTLAAVMNAVSRAVGHRVTDLPLTARRVLGTLRVSA